MSARLESLEAIESRVWHELGQAVDDNTHAWRCPVLATVDEDGADARTVILREVDAHTRQLIVYTDQRAGKVAQLLRHPNGSMVMWSPALGWQLRCRVRLGVQTSGIAASSRWARIRLSRSAQDYLSPLPPGAPLEQPPAGPPLATGHPYFAVIEAEVLTMDWLELHADGHRRAVFGESGARWVQP
jgi:pyridoxamine 5'-phosphate oxidase